MSDIYTLVSNREELKLLIEELQRTEMINHFDTRPKDNNGSNKYAKSNLTDINNIFLIDLYPTLLQTPHK